LVCMWSWCVCGVGVYVELVCMWSWCVCGVGVYELICVKVS
jgi:hypothetical protein